jgi:hypothetical protein
MTIQTDLDTGSKIVHKATTSNLNPDVDPFLFQSGGGFGGMDEFADIEVWPWQGYIADGTNPDISASGSNVCIVYMQNGDVKCSYSTNGGDSFSASTVATGASYPAVYVSGSDVHCAYIKDNNLYYVASEDNGANWDEPMQINEVDGSVLAEAESIDLIDSGAVWTDTRNGENDIYFASVISAPLKPSTPDGPESVRKNRAQTYKTTSADPQGKQLYYIWDWDDGPEETTGPFDSGIEVSASHTWSADGNYNIRVKARNTDDVESPWSDPFPINVAKSKSYARPLFVKILARFPILKYILGL